MEELLQESIHIKGDLIFVGCIYLDIFSSKCHLRRRESQGVRYRKRERIHSLSSFLSSFYWMSGILLTIEDGISVGETSSNYSGMDRRIGYNNNNNNKGGVSFLPSWTDVKREEDERKSNLVDR